MSNRALHSLVLGTLALTFAPMSATRSNAETMSDRLGSLSSLIPSNMAQQWIVTVGAQVAGKPIFEGSKGFDAIGFPILGLRPVGAKEFPSLPGDGMGISLVTTDYFRFGPVGQYRSSRKESDSSSLRGLGDVDWALELGFFAEYWLTDYWRSRVEVRAGVAGHDGVVADLSTDLFIKPTASTTFTIGPRLTFIDDSYAQTYFGVTAAQSRRSGLSRFDAGSGLKDVGVATSLTYDWSKQIATTVFGEYDRFVGDVSDSPVVRDRGTVNQFTFGAELKYKFQVAW